VMETLRRIAATAGITVIANLHHVEYARRYADRVLGLHHGRLIFNGSPVGLTEEVVMDLFGDVPTAAQRPSPLAVREPIWVSS
jgi:phosphonate transport system ATP-binding protein